MPELPEVEIVCRGLAEIFSQNTGSNEQAQIEKLKLLRADLRFTIPKNLPQAVAEAFITGVRRRAKYILIDTTQGIILSHLGMTGSWRMAGSRIEKLGPHDHVLLDLSDGRRLIFRDPRRFGLLDFIKLGAERSHKRLRHLGPEPLEPEGFNSSYLFKSSRKRKVAIKTFVMNQETVVGVGNIYASEALFRAKINPSKIASKMTEPEAERIVDSIAEVLKEAINAGGSSISDYRQASGSEGDFQNAHRVYDREGEPCPNCRAKIRSKVLGGRSTYWCPKCQK
jgi:formamidopyrimidine-DNA glycosylase